VTRRIRVGTRRSRLARAQTDLVLRQLARLHRELRFEAHPVDTSGDRNRAPGTAPDFTDTIDRALLRGEVDLAVHSAKDLSARLATGLELAACPRRADPRDCLVVRSGLAPSRLPLHSRLGSSSLRRRAQLLRWRPDLSIEEIRGNVDSRLAMARAGRLDGVVLAVAGLLRLGRSKEIGRILSEEGFLPAPAQGALALVVRVGDREMRSIARAANHSGTQAEVLAERAFTAALGGDCRVPLAARASASGRRLTLTGEVLSLDGTKRIRRSRSGSTAAAERLGTSLGLTMIDRGALDLFERPRP
jgi:hydroxymethylbilane synthase